MLFRSSDEPWAKQSFPAAEEQFLLQAPNAKPAISEVAKGGKTTISSVKENAEMRTIKGDNFVATFDMTQGTINSLAYNGQPVFVEGNGPELSAIRAFTNNDNWFYSPWFDHGLHNLRHKAVSSNVITKKDGTIVLAFTVESQAPNAGKIEGGTSSGKNRVVELTDRPFGPNDFKFTTNQIWTVYPDGSIELQSSITSNRPSVVLPRLGYVMQVPQDRKSVV